MVHTLLYLWDILSRLAILTCCGLFKFIEIDGPTITAGNTLNASFNDHHYTEVTVEKRIVDKSKDQSKPLDKELKKYIMDRLYKNKKRTFWLA